MKMTSYRQLYAFGLVLVVLIHTAVSLPPDFFRTGRAGDLPMRKRASAERAILNHACDYCGSFDEELGMECKQTLGPKARFCMESYVEFAMAMLRGKNSN